MYAELWAILTALCWSIGSYFEKKGVHAGNFEPVLGATIRTVVSMAVLTLLSLPFWGQIKEAGVKPTLMVAISGGVFSGALGIMFLYKSISAGNLSLVMPIAFSLTIVFGSLMGVVFGGEKVHPMQALGIGLTVIGAAMTAYFRHQQ